MSEVVKKLVTELGFKLVDQDKIKKYSNTAKDILKTQKETNKATNKNLQQTKEQLSNLEKNKKTFQRNLANDLKNIQRNEKEISKIKEANLKNFRDISLKTEKEIQRKRALIQRQEERNLRGQERRDIIANNRRATYDRKLNFGAGQRGSSFDTRMNDILARKGKMIDPNNPNRIINIPKTPTGIMYPTTSEKQGAREDILTNVGQRTSEASINILKDSADTFLNFSNQMKELEVFGGLNQKDLSGMKKQILSSALKYGFLPKDVAEIGIGYGLAGVKGEALKNITEVTTGTARAGRTTPQKSEEVLNAIGHQFGIDFDNFGKVSKMADAVITVMNESKLGFEDVNVAMKYFGPMAQQMGMTLEDTLTLVGLWSQRGIKGSTPGTSGRQAIIKTAQELANMWETGQGDKGSKGALFKKKKGKMDKSISLAELGITKESVLDKKGKFNFFKLIEQLRGAFKKKGFNEFQRLGALTDIFGVIPSSALASLMKDYSKTDLALIQHMANTKGAMGNTAGALMGSQKMQLAQTQTQIDIAKINLGGTLSKDINALNFAISNLAQTYNNNPQLQTMSSSFLRLGAIGGTLVGATAGIRLLALALGAPVFAVGAPWLIAITALTLGINDVWNAFAGRDSWLLERGKGINSALEQMGRSFNDFITGAPSQLAFILDGGAGAMDRTSSALAKMGQEADIAKQKLTTFLEQYNFLSMQPDLTFKINVDAPTVPYAPGVTPPPKKPNYVLSSSMNKSTASRI